MENTDACTAWSARQINIKVITEYAGIAPDMLTEVLETAALSAVEELEPGFQKLARNGIINGTEVPMKNYGKSAYLLSKTSKTVS